MRLIIPVAALAVVASFSEGFSPSSSTKNNRFGISSSRKLFHSRAVLPSTTARAFGLDPSAFHDLPQHVQSLHDVFSTFSLADALSGDSLTDATIAVRDQVAPATDAIQSTVDAVGMPASDSSVVGDVVEQATQDNGWFGFLTLPIEGLLQLIHTAFVTVGVSSDSWGISIVILTLFIKALTYPLTKTQLESTTKMQALSPKIKEIQTKYQSNPEVMNQKIAEFYQVNEINPLAGCFPSLIQIPVFIGLYRAVLDLAKENKLNESFLWLPSLEGPTYGADPAHGTDWLFDGWIDGIPPLGWPDTTAFLILPVLLVISQFVSMELMQPKTDDPAQQQSNVILKILPVMIGWFALNVPSALCLYWMVNNIVTTATSLYIRNTLKVQPIMSPGGGGAATMSPPPSSTIFAPPREKPVGFGSPPPSLSISSDEIKPITAAKIVDAEIVEDKKKSRSTAVESISVRDDAGENHGGDDDDDDAPQSVVEQEKKIRGSAKKKRKKRKSP